MPTSHVGHMWMKWEWTRDTLLLSHQCFLLFPVILTSTRFYMFKHLENRRWKTHCCFNFPSMCVGAAAAGAVAASRVRCAVNAVIYNKLLYTKQTSLSLFVLSVCLFNTTSTSSTTKKCPFFLLSLSVSLCLCCLFVHSMRVISLTWDAHAHLISCFVEK